MGHLKSETALSMAEAGNLQQDGENPCSFVFIHRFGFSTPPANPQLAIS
jgi:hypothetical protein